MNLPSEIFGDVIVVHTPEELGSDHADQLERYLTTLERNCVVLDLDNTEMIDSAGLTVVMDTQANLRGGWRSENRHEQSPQSEDI